MSITQHGDPQPAVSVRRALLIGILYTGFSKSEQLEGTDHDVLKMKDILLRCFDYLEEDIVVMIDNDHVAPHLKPTKVNILREIRRLVEGAKDGDHFLFHYSGHSDQIQTESKSEDDGMDETIVCADHEQINDNQLKEMLVNPLPLGSSLTAIFDSCSSGTLLDLEHYTCNNVWVPWINKGTRRSDTLRNGNTRSLALSVCGAEQIQLHDRENSESPKNSVNSVMRHTSSPLGTSVSSDKKLRRKRSTRQQVTLRDLSIDHIKQIYEKQKSDSIDGVTSAITDDKTQSFVTAPRSSAEKGEVIARRHSGFSWQFDSDRRTESPVPICTRSCNGWCRNETNVSNHKQAHVISISASRDGQAAWGSKGHSMTLSLIKILEDAPPTGITYHKLMDLLNHRLHDETRKMHRFAKEKKRMQHLVEDNNIESNPSDNVEMNNFQEPQLGSRIPLDMDQLFVL